jgi:carboxyl-terminal processing protease
MTSGDEGGLAHPTVKGPARFTTGNPIVKINNLPAVSLTTPTTGNNMNNGLGAVLVPSVTNVFFTAAEPVAPPLGSLDGQAMRALGEALDGSEFEHHLGPGGVGIVRIGLFAFATPSRVRAAIDDLSRGTAPHGLERLVLDLRGCPGGDALAAAELAGDFLPEDSVLATVLEPDGDERTILARHAASSPDVPLEIWIDGGTASAAEIFAGALQHHGRARLRGTRSRGKATMQRVLPGLDTAAASYETVGEARLPSGRSVEGVGLTPDLLPE